VEDEVEAAVAESGQVRDVSLDDREREAFAIGDPAIELQLTGGDVDQGDDCARRREERRLLGDVALPPRHVREVHERLGPKGEVVQRHGLPLGAQLARRKAPDHPTAAGNQHGHQRLA